jgi:hypothetical protein
METTNTQEEAQHPLVTYTNRLQRQFLIVTSLLYEQNVRPYVVKTPMLGIISNLPKEGQDALKNETAKLLSTDSISLKEISDVYVSIHNWAYDHLFKEAFAMAQPRIKQTAKIGLN